MSLDADYFDDMWNDPYYDPVFELDWYEDYPEPEPDPLQALLEMWAERDDMMDYESGESEAQIDSFTVAQGSRNIERNYNKRRFGKHK